MKKTIFSAALALAMSAGSALASDGGQSSGSDDRQAVEQVVNQFYASLNALFNGEALPMQEIWSHADDVTFMGPVGGFQTGWTQVWGVWQQQAALKLGGKVLPTELHITLGSDLAFVECYEVGDNNTPDGRPIPVAIRATTLLRKESGQWKLIGHHTDPIRALEQDETDAEVAGDTLSEVEPTVIIEGEINAPGDAPGAAPNGEPNRSPNSQINDQNDESAARLEEAE